MLRWMFWPKREEVAGDWSKSHSEGGEKIMDDRMGKHVTLMWEVINSLVNFSEKMQGSDHVEEVGVDRRKICEFTLRK
jgi:hypothetical protein